MIDFPISDEFLSAIEDIFQSDIVELLFESCHVPLQKIVQDTVYVLFDINGLNFVKIRKSTLVLAALAVTKIYVGQTVKTIVPWSMSSLLLLIQSEF